MKKELQSIERAKKMLLKANIKAFKSLCKSIEEAAVPENEGVTKVSERCFIVKSSVLINRPWSLSFASNEVACKILLANVKSIFAKNNDILDVINYFKEKIQLAKDDLVTIALSPKDTYRIRKSIIEKIVTLINK